MTNDQYYPTVDAVGSPTELLTRGPTVVEFFDFFFSDNLGAPADDFNLFLQWQVTGGSVDFVGGFGPGIFGAPPDEPRGRYVDLGGSTGDPGRFETRLAYPVLPNQLYNLTFEYRSTGGDLNSATVQVGDKIWTVSTSSTEFQTFSQNFTFEELGAVRIVFQGAEDDLDGSGIGIDGVLFGQFIEGQPGSYVGTSGDDTYNGAVRDDLIQGRGGSDRLAGGDGDDQILGGDGDDQLSGQNGVDLLQGGAGSDRLDGGSGFDTASYIDAETGVTVSLRSAAAQDTGAGRDSLISIEGLVGSAFIDRLVGNTNNNSLDGGAGDDSLYGLEGNDRMFGDAGDDYLVGGTGADTLTGGSGDDALRGDAGDDRLIGDAGNDALNGADGDDRLEGGDGADSLRGGSGDDQLVGGTGDDRLEGEAGNDAVRGGAGADAINGGEGDDNLRGEDGNDLIRGGSGSDVVTGGAGADTFQFRAGELTASEGGAYDRITDFDAAQGDRIDLRGLDADTTTAGDQAFSLVGAFSGSAGEYVRVAASGYMTAFFDTDGDGASDFALRVDGRSDGQAGWLL